MTIVALESQTETIGYNGWTNRETWLVNLWLGNDMSSYDFLQRICKKQCETWEKAEELEAHFQDELEGSSRTNRKVQFENTRIIRNSKIK